MKLSETLERRLVNESARRYCLTQRRNDAKTCRLGISFPGDHSGGGPPVPISNTEVKPTRADNTWALGPGKIGRRQDYYLNMAGTYIIGACHICM